MAKSKLSLEIVKGYDRNKVPFSAFVLCTDEDARNITEAASGKKSLDLSQLKIVYKIIGHNVDLKTQNDVIEYLHTHHYEDTSSSDVELGGVSQEALGF